MGNVFSEDQKYFSKDLMEEEGEWILGDSSICQFVLRPK